MITNDKPVAWPASPAHTPAEKMAQTKSRARRPRNKPKPRQSSVQCKLRVLRESLNLTLRDVASGAKITIAGLHRIELGGDVRMTSALKLCKFYGRTLDELWSE